MSQRIVLGDCLDVFRDVRGLGAVVSDPPAGTGAHSPPRDSARTQYIYALRDPFTFERRYVGKSKDPEDRLKKHLKPYYMRPDTYKNRWLRKVLARGGRPILEILCEADDCEDINQIERDFIRWLRVSNRLTNGTDGGDGGNTSNGGRRRTRTGPSPMRGVKWAVDDPRRAQLRERQRGKAPLHATTKAVIKNKYRWLLTAPDGKEFAVNGLSEFCVAHNLIPSKMSAVARGEANRTHHKGWRCVKLEKKDEQQ